MSYSKDMKEAIKQQIAQGHKPIRLADFYNTLADICCHERNPKQNLQKAVKYYTLAKKEQRNKNNFPLANAYYGLAFVYMKLGCYVEANKYACRCIEIRRKLYTSDHRSIQKAQVLLTKIAESRPPVSKNEYSLFKPPTLTVKPEEARSLLSQKQSEKGDSSKKPTQFIKQ